MQILKPLSPDKYSQNSRVVEKNSCILDAPGKQKHFYNVKKSTHQKYQCEFSQIMF